MSKMTKLEGVPDKDDAKPGTAFYAGTGPSGKYCGDCRHRGYSRQAMTGTWNEKFQQTVYKSYRVSKCAKFKSMTGEHGADVDAINRSCKYFEQKKN